MNLSLFDERSELLLANSDRDHHNDHHHGIRSVHLNSQNKQQVHRSKLQDLNQDMLSVILKFCSDTTDIESLKYSCKSLYWLISVRFDLLREDFQAEIIISWDNFHILLESIEHSCFKLIEDDNKSTLTDSNFLTYYDTVLQSQHVSLARFIENWKLKYPDIVDTKNWTVNACRLFKKFILHVIIANEEALNNAVVTINNKESGHCIYSGFIFSTPEENIDLKKGIVYENFKALYRFRGDNYLQQQFISNIIFYIIFRHRLVKLMEKTNISLKKIYSKNIIRKFKYLSRSDNTKARNAFYNFLCIQDNVLRRFKYNVLNGKTLLPKLRSLKKRAFNS